jgi:hypothetical protein
MRKRIILDKQFEELRQKLHSKNTENYKKSINQQGGTPKPATNLSNDIESLVYQNVVQG